MAPQTRARTAGLSRFRLLDLPDHIVDQIVVTAVGSREEAMAIWPTCKAFFRPAMVVAWRHVRVRVPQQAGVGTPVALVACLNGSHRLGRRVRQLDILALAFDAEEHIDVRVVKQLFEACPNLVALEIFQLSGLRESLREEDGVLAIIGRTPIVTLTLCEIISEDVDLEDQARLLATIGPRLRNLDIRVRAQDPDALQGARPAITTFALPQLRTLSVAQLGEPDRSVPQLDSYFRMIGASLPAEVSCIDIHGLAPDEVFPTLLSEVETAETISFMHSRNVSATAWQQPAPSRLALDRQPLETLRTAIDARMLTTTPHRCVTGAVLRIIVRDRAHIQAAAAWLNSFAGERPVVMHVRFDLSGDEDEGKAQREFWDDVQGSAGSQVYAIGDRRPGDLGIGASEPKSCADCVQSIARMNTSVSPSLGFSDCCKFAQSVTEL